MTKQVAAYIGLTLMTAVLVVIDFCSDMWLTNADWRNNWDHACSISLTVWLFVTAWFLLED